MAEEPIPRLCEPGNVVLCQLLRTVSSSIGSLIASAYCVSCIIYEHSGSNTRKMFSRRAWLTVMMSRFLVILNDTVNTLKQRL